MWTGVNWLLTDVYSECFETADKWINWKFSFNATQLFNGTQQFRCHVTTPGNGLCVVCLLPNSGIRRILYNLLV